MAKKRSRTSRSAAQKTPHPNAGSETEYGLGFTGRHIVLLRDDGVKEGLQAIKTAAGLAEVCNSADYEAAAVEMAEAENAEVFVLDKLKVAIVNADATQVVGLTAAAAENGAIVAVEPERMMYALTVQNESLLQFPLQYLTGYKDAVNHLYSSLTGAPSETEAAAAAVLSYADNAQFTWGLQATRVSQSQFSGRGIRVAVLDTGFDLDHPDFVGRTIFSQSFIQGQAVSDLNGHGTHCIGTSLGPQHPAGGVRRYGCAFRAEIYAGKVLSNGI